MVSDVESFGLRFSGVRLSIIPHMQTDREITIGIDMNSTRGESAEKRVKNLPENL